MSDNIPQLTPKPTSKRKRSTGLQPLPSNNPMRSPQGKFVKGHPVWPGIDAGRARKSLNVDTIREMHEAFRRGGRKAIDKVMKQSPAIFLKLLVLLVPRDIEVTHKGGVKAMSDEQIDHAIEAIEAMLAKRDAGSAAKVINAVPALAGSESDDERPRSANGLDDNGTS